MKKKQPKQQLAFFEGGEKAKAAELIKSAALTLEAERLLANFEALAEAPEGVKRLRELILEMAVRGQLVDQDPNEEPACDLLKRSKLQTAQAQLQKRRRIKASTPIAQSEHPPLADGWSAARWSDVGLCQNGRAFPSDDYELHGVKLLRPGNLHVSSHVTWNEGNTRYLPERYAIENPEFVVGGGELVMNLTAQSLKDDFLGRTCITNKDERCLLNQRIARLTPTGIEPRYLIWYFRSPFFRRYVAGLNKGTLIQHMFTSQVDEAVILIPPLAEQARIVAKVDELMALCDEMEARQAKRRVAAGRLNKAALGELTSAEGPEELAASLQRVVGNFEALADKPESVEELRCTVLDLAIRARLVPQQHGDTSASSLLQSIDMERERRISAGQLRRAQAMPEALSAAPAFALPETWQWARMGDLCFGVADGPHFSPKYVSADGGVPFLSAGNIRPFGIEMEEIKYVSQEDHEKFCARTRPESGDVLYTKGGTTGVAAVNTLTFEFSVWVHVAVLKVAKEQVFPRYLALALNSPHCYAQSQKLTHGTGNRDLGLTRMILITVPLPPLAEQARIVAKVDHLLALCDTLEAKLRAADEGARRLAESLVAELLA